MRYYDQRKYLYGLLVSELYGFTPFFVWKGIHLPLGSDAGYGGIKVISNIVIQNRQTNHASKIPD